MACKYIRFKPDLSRGAQKRTSFYRSRDMATTCPGPGKCGTVAPVWLDLSSAVNLTANTFSVDACVSWGFGDGGFDNFDCCLFTLPVKVKNCQGFRVYYLGPTQACDIAYCSAPTGQSMPGGGGTLEQGKQTSIFRVIFFLRLSLSRCHARKINENGPFDRRHVSTVHKTTV